MSIKFERLTEIEAPRVVRLRNRLAEEVERTVREEEAVTGQRLDHLRFFGGIRSGDGILGRPMPSSNPKVFVQLIGMARILNALSLEVMVRQIAGEVT